MNRKQIAKFVKKVNYDIPITIKYFSNKDTNSAVAYVKYSRILNEDNSIYVYSIIYINRTLKKHLKLTTLKASLIHEVGHLYTGYKISNNKICELSKSTREYEAQVWSIKRAKALKMSNIRRSLMAHLSGWQNFNGNTPQRIYKNAWKMAVKNRIIPYIA